MKSLAGKATPSKFTYYVGSGSVNTFDLAFTQDPSCGYDVSVEMITALPSFMVYNADQQDYTVFSTDIKHAGKDSYQARALVNVPTDYTL